MKLEIVGCPLGCWEEGTVLEELDTNRRLLRLCPEMLEGLWGVLEGQGRGWQSSKERPVESGCSQTEVRQEGVGWELSSAIFCPSFQ